jgi:hypothetical protein
MAQYEVSHTQQSESAIDNLNGWAVGFIFLGAVMMMLLGSFHIIAGISGLLDDDFYTVRPNFALELDVTAWGWTHIIGGIVLMVSGLGLLTGSVAARMVAIVAVVLACVWNFYSIPYYPVWSILMLAMCIGVLWALIAHGHEFTEVMKE